MTPIDWSALMRAGLCGLRLTPEQFWKLTPAELRLMLGQGVASGSLDRDGLDRLLSAFPDEITGEQDV